MREVLRKLFKNKYGKIGLAVVCIAAVLAAAFFLQPAPNRSGTGAAPASSSAESMILAEESQAEESSRQEESRPGDPSREESREEETAPTGESREENSAAAESQGSRPSQTASAPTADAEPAETQVPAQPSTSAPAGTEASPETSSDDYRTDPAPEGKPEPVEPEETTAEEEKEYTCTVSIRCDTILNNMDLLKEEKKDMVPSNGVILAATSVTFHEGESVFDVLQRVTREKRIHLEYTFTPLYNSAYIEGIHNLYEFDCGDLSGWMYKVNGWFPNYGCSQYQLQQGDVIEWVYTCDLGYDVGGGYAAGE